MKKPNPKKNQLISEMTDALEPLAQILAGQGVAKEEFSKVAADAYANAVDGANSESGRPRTPERGKYSTRTEGDSSRKREIARLLHFWFTDPEFTDVDGKPKNLLLPVVSPATKIWSRSMHPIGNQGRC